jgi:hypothetical protein
VEIKEYKDDKMLAELCLVCKNERTIHANETKEKRKRYEISVNLNDPGSVSDNPGYYWPLTTSTLANGMSETTFI